MLHREKEIATNLIRSALARGWRVSVRDGIEHEGRFVISSSTDFQKIFNALETTGYDGLYFNNGETGLLMGVVYLIWGNDDDIIYDCSPSLDIDEDGCIASSSPNYDPFGKYIGAPRQESGWTA